MAQGHRSSASRVRRRAALRVALSRWTLRVKLQDGGVEVAHRNPTVSESNIADVYIPALVADGSKTKSAQLMFNAGATQACKSVKISRIHIDRPPHSSRILKRINHGYQSRQRRVQAGA